MEGLDSNNGQIQETSFIYNDAHVDIDIRTDSLIFKRRGEVMVFNTTFNNISVISWQLVKETREGSVQYFSYIMAIGEGNQRGFRAIFQHLYHLIFLNNLKIINCQKKVGDRPLDKLVYLDLQNCHYSIY